jgi:hypothetical protein
MDLFIIGLRLVGTCLSLGMGAFVYDVSDDEMMSKLSYYCLKISGLCCIVGGTLMSWFMIG